MTFSIKIHQLQLIILNLIYKALSEKKINRNQYCKQHGIIIIPAWSDQDTVLHKTIIKKARSAFSINWMAPLIVIRINSPTEVPANSYTRHSWNASAHRLTKQKTRIEQKLGAKIHIATLRLHQQTQSTYTNPIIININILKYLYTLSYIILYLWLG